MGIARIDNLDGKEPIRNVLNTTAVGGAAGIAYSGTNLVMFFPKTFGEAVGRSLTHTATFAMMGAVFGAGTTISASVRGKDDLYNYFIGGCLSGVMLGAKTHSYPIGSGACVGLGSLAAFSKLWHRQGWGPVVPKPTY
ncbi:NADH dehydrogenase [ubiquinone] 1 alpha subcomplex subunit 11-like [Asterias rubens]|uniref:NADH dehydrogenase [ubiquinone] 1 alpha subcomplex subunit 11-like n=1 Tax=Asterias rubens TaxID=7604 RepID=UPI0014557EC4|nr:NADH dehydrogenase [ubiquinone] 1 alpha subcomplex subunit 11-like [Asterias rubens]